MNQFVGPSVLFGSLASLWMTGVINIPIASIIVFAIYLSGIMPNNGYFPKMWFQSNIFNALYSLYCADEFGYKYLRPVIHLRQRLPHSDYRHGVRCLSENHKPPPEFERILKNTSDFYNRGGGVADLKELGERHKKGFKGVTVVPVPLLTDNYAYLILSFLTKRCAVVDPADPKLVLYMLAVIRHYTGVDFVLSEILTTHKHWDHAGGNLELLQLAKGEGVETTELVDAQLKIYGSAIDKPHASTNFIKNGDVLSIADGAVKVAVILSPGHTAGSVLFLVGDAVLGLEDPQRLALFTGDCIFSGGCGAMFEATTMDEVLQKWDLFHGEKIRTHPANNNLVSAENVLIYAGHEYTGHLIEMMINIHVKDECQEQECDLEMKKFRNVLREAMRSTRWLRSTRVLDKINETVTLFNGMEGSLSLPGCTMPSTLAIERGINPLLTVKRSVLEELQGGDFSSSELQKVIYNSTKRQIVDL